MKLSKNGFTLVELIITVSVLMMMVGFSIPIFSKFTQSKTLEKETDKLLDYFNLARTRAQSALTDATCTQPFQGYRVSVSANRYTIDECCSGSCTVVSTIELSNNITVTPINSSVLFKVLSGTNISNVQTYKVTNSDNNSCMYITINSIGLISKNTSCP
ncbi:prepilin-type N-terminal cleavage/methylation domain-containing protein [Candidatus Roizmanbacteria bacterium]|nr:prepilin-type N-terminal cleavage/methylation domain-containing protein [Candidatus Roizmanbacteria bacterium]